MSGGDAWAIVEPSTNSTIECTIDCGCTTTSISSYGTPNSRCASITSRPLLTRVAEFVVTTRPMSHVGCASASAGVTVRERLARAAAERAAGCRQHEPADLGGLARAQRLRDRGVLGVDRHDLPGPRSRGDEVAADDERLLVGERERAARLERRERRAEADRPGDAVQDDVGLDIPHQLLGLVGAERGVLDAELVGLRQHRGAVRARRRAPTTSKRPGFARMTSSACVPIDPVEPRISTRRIAASLAERSARLRLRPAASVRAARMSTTKTRVSSCELVSLSAVAVAERRRDRRRAPASRRSGPRAPAGIPRPRRVVANVVGAPASQLESNIVAVVPLDAGVAAPARVSPGCDDGAVALLERRELRPRSARRPRGS